ncbi:MAG TPA: flavodoxin [Actinomycetota bacterium]
MNALVVYESMFGNTAAVGEAVATALREHGVDVTAGSTTRLSSGDAAGVDLVVVGGPTHVHGMSRASSRNQAAGDPGNTYDAPTVEPGLREWIEALPAGDGRLAAAFDTRIDKPVVLTGSAAKGIARRLQRRGYRLLVAPECFLVTTKNRLLDGEIDHATAWGGRLSEAASATTAR